MSREIVFATENPGKLAEIRKFSEQYDIKVLSPSEAGLTPHDVEETGTTYQENAALKVEAYRNQDQAKRLIICADDAGIEIDALGGEPGIHSRRWLGHRMSDDEIVKYATDRLRGVPLKNRTARFLSTVAFSIMGAPVRYVNGEMRGYIREAVDPNIPPQEGFPFRQLFIVEGDPDIPLWRFDDLDPEERQGLLSHREQALYQLFQNIK